MCAVEERLKCSEVEGVTDHVALGSENADISIDIAGYIPARLNPMVSRRMFVLPALVGS